MMRVVQLLSGLEIGGKERVALDLARRCRQEDLGGELVLFDTPFRDQRRDFDPGEVPWCFLPRGPGLDLRFVRRLRRWVRSERPDVVHAHADTAAFYAVLATRGLGRRRPRIVITFHARPKHDTRGARLATRWATGAADVVTVVSTDLGEHLRERGWIRSYRVIPTGVDLRAFAPSGPAAPLRERFEMGPETLLVGHVGREDPVKRTVDLHAAAEIWKQKVPVELILVRPPLDDEAREAPMAGARIVAGHGEMAPLLRAFDILVLCSEYEAAPKVLLEAMACGLAIVATRVGGIPEMVEGPGGPCVRLISPGDPGAIAQAVVELSSERGARRRLARAARQRSESFSHEREWQRYLDAWMPGRRGDSAQDRLSGCNV